MFWGVARQGLVLEGVSLPGAGYVSHSLPESTKKELRWVWDALRSATMCKSLLVVYRGKRVAQFGTVPFAMAGGKRGLQHRIATRRSSAAAHGTDQ